MSPMTEEHQPPNVDRPNAARPLTPNAESYSLIRMAMTRRNSCMDEARLWRGPPTERLA